MKWTQKALAAFLAAAMAVTMAAPAFAKTDKNDLRYLDIVDSDGENAYYDRTDTIKPGDKYYIIIGKSTGTKLDNLLDKKLFSFKLKKQNGGKYISGAEITEKRFGNTRYICIEFDAKDNFTDEENKVTLEAIFRAKEDLAATNWDEILKGDFPIFEPVTSGTDSAAAKEAEKKYKDALAAYNTAVGNQTTAQNKYDAAVKNKNEATQKKANAEKARDEVLEVYGNETTVDSLNALATENTTKATNATNAANLQTAFNALQTAWTNWENVPDFNNASENQFFKDLNAALSNYSAAYTVFSTDPDYTSTIGNISNVTLPEDFPGGNWIDQDSLYNTVRKVLSKTVDDPILYGVEQTYVNNITTKYEATEAADFTQAAKDATDASTKLGDALKAIEEATKDANIDLSTHQTALNNAKSAVTSTEKAKNTAYSLWQSIANGTSSDLFLKDGDEYSFEFTVWIQNERQEDDDANFVAGEKGVVIRPVKNETNTITWENSDRTLARLTFQADSDTDYLCPRLSTRWSNEDYRNFFDDQDAYLFDFVSNPDIPAQTRGTLELYNPFLDRDGDYYRDVRDLYLYQVVDGILKEVDFDPVLENDDGEEVLRLRTRTLGTYVVCEDPLDLDDLYGDEDKDDNKKPSRPSDANKPDIIIDANQKPVPNTGR